MRATTATLAGLMVLATVSAQAAPSPKQENWQPISRPTLLPAGGPGLRRGPPSLPPTRLAGRVVLGSVRSELGTAVHWVWTLPTGLTWLFILGCAVAAWAVVGYGWGYGRGVRDG